MARLTRADTAGFSVNLFVFSTDKSNKGLLCSGRLPGYGSGLRRDERPDKPENNFTPYNRQSNNSLEIFGYF